MRFSRHRRITLALCVGFLLMLFLAPARATLVHVSPFGLDTPPFDTFEKAAKHPEDANSLATTDADTVIVHAGSYDIAATIEVAAGVTWLGVAADSVNLTWTGSSDPPHQMLHANGNNSIEGLRFINPAPQGMPSLVGLTVAGGGSASARVTRCQFLGCRLTKGTLDSAEILMNDFEVWVGEGISIVGTGSTWVHNNNFRSAEKNAGAGKGVVSVMPGWTLIENNVFDYRPAEGRGTPILASEWPNPMIIRNNLILGGSRAILWFSASTASSTGTIENNTIIGPRSSEEGLMLFLDRVDTVVVRNNVFKDFAALPQILYSCPDCAPPGAITFVHNAYWPPVDSFYDHNTDNTIPFADTANMNAFPMFEGDSLYPLQAGSPLIDSGDPSVLDGDGSRSDIGWTGGPGGKSSDYPELAPLPPESIWVDGASTVVNIHWSSRPEADLAGYRLYRGSASGFWEPGMAPIRAFLPGDTSTADTLLAADQSLYYVITAIDTAGLESDTSPEGSYLLTGVFDDPEEQLIPREPSIRRVYPNPFNAAVTIDVSIPDAGTHPVPVEVVIYNLLGQIQCVAFNGPLEPGTHQLTWNGRANDGGSSSSGIYFVRLSAWNRGFGKPSKVVLLR